LPRRGYVSDCSLDPTCSESGGVVIAPQPVSLVDPDSPARLYNPIQTAPVQIQRCLCSATQSSRSLQLRWSLGFTALISSYPGIKAGYDLSWIFRLPFRMLTVKRIFSCIRQQDWFAAIELKDTYFHVSILPRHRLFLRFAFEGQAYQYRVLPFGLALSPSVFTKVAEGALSPLWEMGIWILNYFDDWLIIAHSRDLLCEHRDLVLRHLSHLGFQVNQEKGRLSPVQSISFLGMELDSVNMSARLTNERTHSVLSCLTLFRHKTAVPLKLFQRLLGHMAVAAAVTPLGLLHMRPLQHWFHGRILRWAWHSGTFRVGVTPECRRLFSPWSDPVFLRAGVPLGQVSRHMVVNTDASKTGWGAVCNGQTASGSWSGPRLQWHINCLELLAVLLALRRFLPMLRDKHVLIRTDNVPTVVYINWQGGLRSRHMSQLARHLLLSLRAVHILGSSAPENVCPSPSEPPCTDPEQVFLVAPYWPTWTWFADLMLLATAPPWKIPLRKDLLSQGMGTIWHPRPDLWNLHVWLLDGTWQTSLAFPRPQAYALKWGLFADWCSSRREDPQRCSVGVVLSFLQDKLERRLSPSTLKVYVAAIASYHDVVDGLSLGKHHPLVRFLRGARRLNPLYSHLIPSWDLSVVLLGLRRAPFEPLASVKLKYLSFKTSLLIALTSIKRVGDLHAFSVSESCLEFGPADSHVTMRPRPGYVPKVPTTPLRDQVVNLQALPPEEADLALTLLCPVHALRTYVDRTRSFRCSEQLFVCFGGQQMGNAVSKQRLAHWVVDAITLAYQCQNELCPLGVRAHSTWSVASSWALVHGASLADICRAASWATPNTFARFYNLR
ncbi:hypothetical protein M9458_009029, partial [Cirrhinus mrigala]